MTSEFVKLYFALGAFVDETDIDATITLSDFTMDIVTEEPSEEPEEPTEEPAKESYDLSLYGTDGILTTADLMKLKQRSMILNAILSDRMTVTIDPTGFIQALADLALGMERDTTIDYGQGFSSVTYIPKKSAKIGYEITIHLGIGAEHAGKTAYLFAKDLTTGELVCKQTSVIHNIGNIAYTTDEYSFMVVLYQ